MKKSTALIANTTIRKMKYVELLSAMGLNVRNYHVKNERITEWQKN